MISGELMVQFTPRKEVLLLDDHGDSLGPDHGANHQRQLLIDLDIG